jgi:cytochrome c5
VINPAKRIIWSCGAAVVGLWISVVVHAASTGQAAAPAPPPATKAPAVQQSAPPQPAPSAAQAGATYVGDADCSTCHDKQHAGYVNTAHNRKWTVRQHSHTTCGDRRGGTGFERCNGCWNSRATPEA